MKEHRLEGVIAFPVRYDKGYSTSIFDKERNKVLDIRGWGRLQYMEDRHILQDEIGEFVAKAINEKYENEVNEFATLSNGKRIILRKI